MKKQCVKNLAKPNNLQAAKEYAFLLLKFRLRSENELAARLRQKKFSESIIQDTLSFLKDKQFIDDRIFAKSWVASRLKRPFGLRRIKQELVGKGLAKEVIETAVVQAKENYNEEAVARQLAEQRFLRIKGVELLKAKARVYGYLIRRGFSPDISSQIVKGL
ncbi:MAG: regulatory protein RecX [Candidatus Omnitrophica bacterium]|nr:regulatory protein RecX [Candidatus Omnitrophota bacterium]